MNFQRFLNWKQFVETRFCIQNFKNLSIPSNVVDLRDGWCNFRYNLKKKKITIFSNKKEENIIYFDNKFILGKRDSKSSKFDIQLNKVEFVNNSKLKLIEKFSFSNTSIKSISFPPKVKIRNYTFYRWKKFKW